uniref:Ig-like domain-containing protein n=1 Tax=Oryzias latipes TaxID=8090 RepID=A0A3B3IJP8_ORYLA
AKTFPTNWTMKGSPETSGSERGQNVSLTCDLPDPDGAGVLEWTRADLKEAYVFRDRTPDPDLQHPSFRNRVSLQDGPMWGPDRSVVLQEVTLDDSGTYECRVLHGGPDSGPISTVQLVVVPGPARTGTTSPACTCPCPLQVSPAGVFGGGAEACQVTRVLLFPSCTSRPAGRGSGRPPPCGGGRSLRRRTGPGSGGCRARRLHAQTVQEPEPDLINLLGGVRAGLGVCSGLDSAVRSGVRSPSLHHPEPPQSFTATVLWTEREGLL